MDKRNLRRLNCLVTAQTYGNLEKIQKICGYKEIGRVVDKIMKEKMTSMRSFGQCKGCINEDSSRSCKECGDCTRNTEWVRDRYHKKLEDRR